MADSVVVVESDAPPIVVVSDEDEPTVTTLADDSEVTVVVSGDGPRGPKGEDAATASHYEYTQGTPAAAWHITHNLGKHPSVTVLDSANSQVEGDVVYNSINDLTINFSGAFSGVAYLN